MLIKRKGGDSKRNTNEAKVFPSPVCSGVGNPRCVRKHKAIVPTTPLESFRPFPSQRPSSFRELQKSKILLLSFYALHVLHSLISSRPHLSALFNLFTPFVPKRKKRPPVGSLFYAHNVQPLFKKEKLTLTQIRFHFRCRNTLCSRKVDNLALVFQEVELTFPIVPDNKRINIIFLNILHLLIPRLLGND